MENDHSSSFAVSQFEVHDAEESPKWQGSTCATHIDYRKIQEPQLLYCCCFIKCGSVREDKGRVISFSPFSTKGSLMSDTIVHSNLSWAMVVNCTKVHCFMGISHSGKLIQEKPYKKGLGILYKSNNYSILHPLKEENIFKMFKIFYH